MGADEEMAYAGFTLIVRHQNGQFKGRAWPGPAAKGDGLTSIALDASDRDDLIRGLKTAVNAAVAAVKKGLLSTLAERHKAYLAGRGIESKGQKFFVRPRLRKANCHSCGDETNNEDSPECLVCNGIICLRCAACLCGTSWNRVR